MKNHQSLNYFCLLATVLVGPVARAQNLPAPQVASAKAPDSLSIYFKPGRAEVAVQGQTTLDQAARTYRDGKPIVMVVSGGTDSTGSAAVNLRLSQQRADNVLQGLVARGIPVERFQILAKGETEPAVAAPEGTPEARNRRVEITWR
jgi:outer membrane protein OmpA-like peptidoglycan-associated protein